MKEDTESNSNTVIHNNLIATTYALILLHRSKFLILYSLKNRSQKLRLMIQSKHRAYEGLIPAEIIIKNEKDLVVSDHSNGLWMANLNKIKPNQRSKDVELFVEVIYLGSLLGSSRAITIPPIFDVDTTQYLYYYIPRDGAVVRWNFRYGLHFAEITYSK